MKIFMVLIALLIVGCAPSRVEPRAGDAGLVEERIFLAGTYVYVFRLKDGTRCAATTRGGIDCDFNNKGEK